MTHLFERMLTIRLVEDRLQALCLQGEAGDLHFSKGQEAISVGVCAALATTDHIVTHHRTIAHEIAKGADIYPLVAEVLTKATGLNGGRAGEMHLSNPAIRHDFSFQIVGTCIPVAVGLAWALKNHHKTDEVVACFFGDAATSNGAFHEGVNIAAIHKVPVLLVCENNGLAGNIRSEHYQSVQHVNERMRGFGVRSFAVDGNDVQAVQDMTGECLAHIRQHGGPVMLEADTTRLCWHKQGQRDIRTAAELAELSLRDPLLLEARRQGISAEARVTMETRINVVLNDIFARVAADPIPEVLCA